MYFLIGLGIIVIVSGNMLYDQSRQRRIKDTTDVEVCSTADNHFAEQKETKGQKTEINKQAPDQDQSGSMVKNSSEYCFFRPNAGPQMICG